MEKTMKKLFLTSSTITPNLTKPFEELCGKQIKGLRAVFIPDACYGVVPKKDLSWVQEEKQCLIDELNWEVTEVKLKDLQKVTVKDFENVDVIFVNGGFSGYLANEMRRTEFDKILLQLLEKGIVYVGSSAGSMVCSGYQIAAEVYIGEPEENASKIEGLNLYVTAVFLANIVIPLSLSWSLESIIKSWDINNSFSLKVLDCFSSPSTIVVFPWSTCAIIAIFLNSIIFINKIF